MMALSKTNYKSCSGSYHVSQISSSTTSGRRRTIPGIRLSLSGGKKEDLEKKIPDNGRQTSLQDDTVLGLDINSPLKDILKNLNDGGSITITFPIALRSQVSMKPY